MRATSAAFRAAVASSHHMTQRCRIVAPGQNGTAPTALQSLAVETGSVTLDSTAQIRGSLALTVGDTWPTAVTSPLTPYGNEIFVERGIMFGDGHSEWVSQGYYRINSVEQQGAPRGPLTVDGQDRMCGIIDARILSPITFVAGQTIISVIEALILAVYPWAVFDYDASLGTSVLASTQVTTDDRYQFIDDLVTSQGMVWYWDYRGYLYIHPAPSNTTPTATIKSGAGGVLVSLSRTLNRTGVYNACVASGQDTGSGTLVTATAYDNNPGSPTYWFGQFGQVPQFYSSSFITTYAQALSAAVALLNQSTGLPYNVDFGQVPNPALEPLDCVQVSYATGVGELHVLESITLPLDAATVQSATTRQQYTGVFSH